MHAIRFIVPVLIALTMIVGDCAESQARCRIFGRRRARQCCPPPCYPPSPSSSPPQTHRLVTTTICPLYKTTYDMGGGYWMFYCGEYTSNGCGTNPQPGYLLADSCQCCQNDSNCQSDPARCRSGSHACWTVGSPLVRLPNLADTGHCLKTLPPGAHRQVRVNVGGGLRHRNISFHTVPIPGKEPLFVGFEFPDADVPPGGLPDAVPHSTENWHDHSTHGRLVRLGKNGPNYFVLLKSTRPCP